MIAAEAFLWGNKIGTIVYNDNDESIKFSYDKSFINSGIELSPITMPLNNSIYSFPDLKNTSFYALPGLFSDSLPDTFGNHLINEYLSRKNRPDNSMNPVEKLLYVGSRGLGALEYRPAFETDDYDGNLELDELTKLAEQIITQRKSLKISASEKNAIEQLIQVGSSVGGSRAKANIAWNEEKDIIRSGQINAGEGFSYWILKFDFNRKDDAQLKPSDREYTKIEYAYYLMATKAGINMSECKLYKDGDCSHFITKRFDRNEKYEKVFTQSLGALCHYDYNEPRCCSYEQIARTMGRLSLSQSEKEQMFLRVVFNELAKNYDDHVKNFGFMMDKQGKWKLSPAYDITYAFNTNNIYLKKHQMLLNGKSEDLNSEDFVQCGKTYNLDKNTVLDIIDRTSEIIKEWPSFAEQANLSEERMNEIKGHHNELLFRK